MNIHKLFGQIHESITGGKAIASATVMRVKGSTPREVGAKMIISANGNFSGTIGGGCGEAEVWRKALWAIHQGKPCRIKVDLTGDPTSDSPKICGGIMEVLVDAWNQNDAPLISALLDSLVRNITMVLVTIVGEEGGDPGSSSYQSFVGRKLLVGVSGRVISASGQVISSSSQISDSSGQGISVSGQVSSFLEQKRLEQEQEGRTGSTLEEHVITRASTLLTQERSELATIKLTPSHTVELFFEVLPRRPSLVIVGAGHIAQPLVTLGKLLDFTVMVLDDRPEYATFNRFPDADLVRVLDMKKGLEIPLAPKTFVVLVTRGHRHDEEVLRQILFSPVEYIGMIGSRRRIRAVFNDLEQEGFPPEKLDRVYAPIGLDIGAQTPAEIALCIMGEIIKLRRGGSAQSLSMVRDNI